MGVIRTRNIQNIDANESVKRKNKKIKTLDTSELPKTNAITSEEETKDTTPVNEEKEVIPPESLSRKCFEYFKVFMKLAVLIILAPGLINFAALLREEKELKPEGFMIDVGMGQKLFKTCLGKGSPTVLFDSPLGGNSDVWFHVFNEVAKLTKVCTYDRAGLGFSDRSYRDANGTKKKSKPYTVESSVEDFQKLFETEERPFILVGSDHGASVMRFYAQLYPDSVASVIFINAMFNGLFHGNGNPWNEFWFRSVMSQLQMKQISSFTGLTRIGLQTGLIREPFSFKNVPDNIKLRQKYLLCSPGHISSVVEEFYHVNESLAQLRTLKKLAPFPRDINVTLIFSDKYDDSISMNRNKVWLKSQELVEQEFIKEMTNVVRFKGYFPKLFFTAPKKIVKIISDNIYNWKKSTKLKF